MSSNVVNQETRTWSHPEFGRFAIERVRRNPCIGLTKAKGERVVSVADHNHKTLRGKQLQSNASAYAVVQVVKRFLSQSVAESFNHAQRLARLSVIANSETEERTHQEAY